jgi:hypothetical protein
MPASTGSSGVIEGIVERFCEKGCLSWFGDVGCRKLIEGSEVESGLRATFSDEGILI